MPTQIKEMPKSNRGRAKKYDFSKQFDGNTWIILKGDAEDGGDFDCEVASIRAHLYREVHEAGKQLKSSETTAKNKKGEEVPALAFKVVEATDKPASKDESKSKTSAAA